MQSARAREWDGEYESRQANHASRPDRAVGCRCSFRLAGHVDAASGRCRHRIFGSSAPALAGRPRARNPRRHARGHRHRICDRPGRCSRARWCPPPSTCWRRCAGSASTTRWSRSTVPKCRSWTAARRRSSRRSIRSASRRSISRAATSRCSSRCGSRWAMPSANCGRMRAASGSRSRSNSIIR